MKTEITLSILNLAIALLPILVGGTIGILKLTRWGKANADALNTVSQGIEIAKQTTGEINEALLYLGDQEKVKPLGVVRAWKQAHMRARQGNS